MSKPNLIKNFPYKTLRPLQKEVLEKLENNWNKYKILTEDNIKMLDINELYILYINKEIIFDKKSEEKFLKYYEKHKGE